MRYDEALEKILAIISNHISDNTIGYKTVRSEYWFGRLVDSKEIIRKIEDIVNQIQV